MSSTVWNAEESPRIRLNLGERDPKFDRTLKTTTTTPYFHRSFRAALAMKGGISLAVWIGGAVAELDILRRVRIVAGKSGPEAYLIAPRDAEVSPHVVARGDLYARLLATRGYDQIEYDVLAGASAGGLNSVLYGVAQRAGADVDEVLRVWVEYGAIWELLRGPAFLPVNSVMQGDRYFWPKVTGAIREFYNSTRRNLEHRVSRVSVLLSATVVDHEDRSELGSREGAGHFRFSGVGQKPHDDVEVRGRRIPHELDGDDAGESDIRRLGYAARSTSSFPGAFEPALIWSHSATESPDPAVDTVDMSWAFHAQRDEIVDGGSVDRPFRVIDGGVTDNIPIDRALRSIRSAPAFSYSNRAILYLEPDPSSRSQSKDPSDSISPPTWPGRRRRNDPVSRFLTTVQSGIGMRGIRESGEREIDEVEAYRRALYLEQGRTATFSVVAKSMSSYDADQAQQAYASYRATADFDTLHYVLSNPSLWQLGTSLEKRVPRQASDPDVLSRLDRALTRAYQVTDPDSSTRQAIAAGSQALVHFCQCAVAWIRAIEDEMYHAKAPQTHLADSAEERETIRSALYDLAQSARETRERHLSDLVAIASEVVEFEKPEERADHASLIANRLVAQWLELEGKDSMDWAAADGIVKRLRDLGKKYVAAEIGEYFWSVVPSRKGVDLAPFVSARGIPESLWGLRFDTISAAEPPQIVDGFAPLVEAQMAVTAEGWLSKRFKHFDAAARRGNLPTGLDANAKLGGSTLFNFGAFLSADWRRNDWWWGRLDASAGIIRFFLTLRTHSLPKDAGIEPPTAEYAQRAILREMDESPDRPYKRQAGPDPVAISNAMTSGRDSLADLSPNYVFAVFSRVVRVALRALIPGRKIWTGAALVAFVPPLAVFAPLAVATMRIPALVSVLLFTVSLSWPPDPAPAPFTLGALIAFVVLGVAYLAMLVVAIVWFFRGLSRRKHLRSLMSVGCRICNAGWIAGLLLLLSIAAAIAAANHALDGGVPTAAFWAFALLGIALAFLSIRRSSKLPGGPGWVESTVIWTGVAAVPFLATIFRQQTLDLLGIVTGWLADRLRDLGWDWLTAILPDDIAGVGLLLAVTAITAILTYGWFGAFTRSRASVLTAVLVLVWASNAILTGALTVWATTATDLAFQGNAIITAPLAAGIVGWLVAGHLIWWFGETPWAFGPRVNDSVYRIPPRRGVPVATR